jgi:hypothetical protein
MGDFLTGIRWGAWFVLAGITAARDCGAGSPSATPSISGRLITGKP